MAGEIEPGAPGLSPDLRQLVRFYSDDLDLRAGAVTMGELAEVSGVDLGELETAVDAIESRAEIANPVVGERTRIPLAQFRAMQGLQE